MKLKHTLSMALLALASLLGFAPRRESYANEASVVGTHVNGILPLVAEAAMTTRYLLVTKGAGIYGMVINGATNRPLGVCLDEPLLGSKAAVAVLGCTPGTIKLRCTAAIAVGDVLYTAANGRIVNTWSSTAYLVGRAMTPATGVAGDDIVEVAHCFPLINSVATL
jgi:Uncharacterized conserved protein (DUF2190)